MLLCIDIGNTHTHDGLSDAAGCARPSLLPTSDLDHPVNGLGPIFARLRFENPALAGLAFCSVVPAATARLLPLLSAQPLPFLHLTHEKNLGLPVAYPRPHEIGPDRLANAVGARAHYQAEAIVIDMGTATTLDIISAERGYEGGIIAPGIAIMRRYLHEQTALLPLLDDNLEITSPIGHSTTEAMRIGTVLGFTGMIQALLDAVLADFAQRPSSPAPVIITTGSTAPTLLKTLRQPHHHAPDITLRGLHAAWHLNAP